jgi:hypothetical protein
VDGTKNNQCESCGRGSYQHAGANANCTKDLRHAQYTGEPLAYAKAYGTLFGVSKVVDTTRGEYEAVEQSKNQ